MRALVLTAALLFAWPAHAADDALKFDTLVIGKQKVDYYFHPGFCRDTGAKCRVLYALPPGPQTRKMVEAGLKPWLAELQAEGWAVLSPVAPNRALFFSASRKLAPRFLEAARKKHGLPDGKVFLFGISNGGKSALEVASFDPGLFHSVTVLPGTLPSTRRLKHLAGLPVNLLVGANDGAWTRDARLIDSNLRKRGGDVALEILPDAGHYAFEEVPWSTLRRYLLRGVEPAVTAPPSGGDGKP